MKKFFLKYGLILFAFALTSPAIYTHLASVWNNDAIFGCALLSWATYIILCLLNVYYRDKMSDLEKRINTLEKQHEGEKS